MKGSLYTQARFMPGDGSNVLTIDIQLLTDYWGELDSMIKGDKETFLQIFGTLDVPTLAEKLVNGVSIKTVNTASYTILSPFAIRNDETYMEAHYMAPQYMWDEQAADVNGIMIVSFKYNKITGGFSATSKEVLSRL